MNLMRAAGVAYFLGAAALLLANVASAQTPPVGKWDGKLTGADTGTITITIDANQQVTADVYSNNYRAHFICTGGLGSPSGSGTGPYYWGFSLFNPNTAPISWNVAGVVDSNAVMTQQFWFSSDGTQNRNGAFTSAYGTIFIDGFD